MAILQTKENFMSIISNYVQKYLKWKYKEIKCNLLDCYATKSYSQEGEDLILKRFFEGKKNGFYVDVGAHHPKRFSNTYLFYQMGWRGINIDPNHDAIKLFKKNRPRDINLECGISDLEGKKQYYIFDEPALNSFSKEYADMIQITTNNHVKDIRLVDVHRLSAVLAANMPDDTIIEFMSIDAEGYDINVLRSNDWSKYRPQLLIVEELEYSFERSSIYKYLAELGYDFFAKAVNSVFYKKNN